MGDASISCFIFYLVGGCMRVRAMPGPSSRCPVLKMLSCLIMLPLEAMENKAPCLLAPLAESLTTSLAPCVARLAQEYDT